MKTPLLFFGFVILIAFIWTSAPAAEVPDVQEIIDRANKAAYYAGGDGKAKVSMTITDAQGRVRNREFIILRKDVNDGGEQKFYVYFRKPGDVRKMVFMVHKKIGGEDDRWLYLPALDLVKRIAASDKRTSFVGSHFLYEDVSGRSILEDDHTLVETDDNYFVLNNVPKDPSTVEFASYKIRIDRRTFMPVKAEYTVVKSRVRDLVNGGETVSVFTDVEYDIGLKDIFTERYLRRAPREARR
jgi:hypothetical protein